MAAAACAPCPDDVVFLEATDTLPPPTDEAGPSRAIRVSITSNCFLANSSAWVRTAMSICRCSAGAASIVSSAVLFPSLLLRLSLMCVVNSDMILAALAPAITASTASRARETMLRACSRLLAVVGSNSSASAPRPDPDPDPLPIELVAVCCASLGDVVSSLDESPDICCAHICCASLPDDNTPGVLRPQAKPANVNVACNVFKCYASCGVVHVSRVHASTHPHAPPKRTLCVLAKYIASKSMQLRNSLSPFMCQ